MSRQDHRKGGSRRPGSLAGASAFAERLTVGALIHGGIRLMGTHQNTVQRTVILGITVMRALVYGAFNALVGMTIHCFSSF